MKNLMMTTALAALLGTAAHADAHMADLSGAEFSVETMMDSPLRVSDLIGQTIYAPADGATFTMDGEVTEVAENWEDIGEINDVILSQEGDIRSINLDVGGFLGLGAKTIAAQMDQLQFVPDADNEGEFFVVYTGARTDLESAETFDAATLESTGDVSYYGTYGSQMSADAGMETDATAEGTETEMAADAGTEADVTAEGTETEMAADAGTDTEMTTEGAEGTELAATEADPATVPQTEELTAEEMAANEEFRPLADNADFVLTAEKLDGAPVYGADGEELGEVSVILLTADGAISELIIDVGGFLGLGEKPVALPFDEVQMASNGYGSLQLMVDHTQEELEQMESWSE